jgi:hypothetical protein
LEKLLRAGSFREMVVRGDDVFVADEWGALYRIRQSGEMQALDVRPDRYLCDLATTSHSLVWTEQIHRMQAAWRRAICVIDLDDERPTTRALTGEESLRYGIHSDGQGGVVISMGMQIARIPPGVPAKLINVVEATPYGPRDAIDQVTFANGLAVDRDWVIWSTRFDKGGVHLETKELEPDHPTRLLRAPLTGGGPIEVLREAHKEDIRLLGAVAGAILFESEDDEVLLRTEDGRVRSIGGSVPGKVVQMLLRTRAVRGDLFMHPICNWESEDECVYVFRRDAKKIEKLPFEAKRFDITEHGLYRLTERGVYVTRH